MPTAAEVESFYTYEREFSATMSGNVAEISVVQPQRQLDRGGTLWAQVGPYIFLFCQETQELFQRYPGLAGVRVVTRTPGGQKIAEALLSRNALNNLTWKRALNIAGKARRDGTRRPTLLEDLVRWGEEHTEHEYNPRYLHS